MVCMIDRASKFLEGIARNMQPLMDRKKELERQVEKAMLAEIEKQDAEQKRLYEQIKADLAPYAPLATRHRKG